MSMALKCVQFLTTWFLVLLVSRFESGSARGIKPKLISWKTMPLKAKENPIYRDPPGKIFSQHQIPNPVPSDPKELRKIIKKFEPLYMSIERPEENSTDENILSRREILARMPTELKSLQFTVPGSDRELGGRASKKLRLWLWNLSSCQVVPLWKDFGATTWPRFVNIGQCSIKGTCSYPKGMQCKPAKYQRIYTLFWVCSELFRSKKGTFCLWVNYPVDVIEKCKCSC